MDRNTGKIVFRHELPENIFIDNLQYDWIQERLFSIAFRCVASALGVLA